MKRIILFVVATLTLAGVANAAPPPQRFLEEQVKAVRASLAVKVKPNTPESAEVDKKLMAIISPVMEFQELSKNALRKHWDTLKAPQRAVFVELFQELVFRSYLKRIRSANENYSVVYEDVSKTPTGADIEAVAKTSKAEIELVFKMEPRDKATNRWVAADVVIDEVSIVENYREQFNKIIAEEGFDALLGKMRKKLRELGSPLGADPEKKATPEAEKPGEK